MKAVNLCYCWSSITCFVIVWLLCHTILASATECGKVSLIRERLKGGNVTLRNEWPFIAALYQSTPLKYICGGTLISDRHILTAAHCIHQRHSTMKLSPNDLKVRLGAYNLTEMNENGVAHRNVSQNFVHPDWRPNDDAFRADIAVLVLNSSVVFSIYIQPICMPANDDDIQGATISVRGTVVGWGLSDNDVHEDVPRQMIAEASNNSNCYRTDPSIIQSMSDYSFCAKSEHGTANYGDSGGGFFVVYKSFWVQYGIVSAIRTNNAGRAAINRFNVYTNVKMFKRWIVQIVGQSNGEIGEPYTNTTLICDYGYTDRAGYACQFNDLNLDTEHIDVVSVTGQHLTNNDNDSVDSIIFNSGLVYALPNGLGKLFQRLTSLQIGKSNLLSLRLKQIRRSSLSQLENLSNFSVLDNDVEVLDEDILWDLHDLTDFRIVNNKLKNVHEKLFVNNERLRIVIIRRNQLESVPKNLFHYNPLLEEVDLDGNALTEIDENIFELNPALVQFSIASNRLETVPGNLLRNKLWLRSVDIGNNSLALIDERFFETNRELRNVSLASNKLEFLPPKLFEKNILIEVLHLAGNFFTTIEEGSFGKNMNVDLNPRLFVMKYALQKLEQFANPSNNSSVDFFEMKRRLRRLDISSMRLRSLPGNLFENATQLVVLNISTNLLTSIDEHMFKWNFNLAFVSLASNRLESLPDNLFIYNIFLEIVQLENNFLQTLDANIFAWNEKLVQIDLASNRLEQVPSLQKCLGLKFLDLSGNLLQSLDERTFAKNVELVDIHLAKNRIESLPPRIFRTNLALERLTAEHNRIKTIDENIFSANTLLKSVSMSDNRLEFLPRNLFQNNSLLEWIEFSQNSLRFIDIDFTKLDRMWEIRFYDNVCVNAIYRNDTDRMHFNKITVLSEFQNLIDTNCSISTRLV